MKQLTVRFFGYSRFSEAFLSRANKVIVRQTPEWSMLGLHPDFGRFIAKWLKEPGGVVVVATQY